MNSLFSKASWNTAEALAAIALGHGLQASADPYEEDVVGQLLRALPHMLSAESQVADARLQRVTSWAKEAKALSPDDWPHLELHPLIWVRWVVSSAEVNRPEPFCMAFADWYSHQVAEGGLPVMLRYSPSRKRWGARKLPLLGPRAEGQPVHAFVLRALLPRDLKAEWKMVSLPLANRAVGDSVPAELTKPKGRRRKSRGSGLEQALEVALDQLSRAPDAVVQRRPKVALGEPPFVARDGIGREHIAEQLRSSSSKLRRNYAPSTTRAVLSSLVVCKVGRPRKIESP